jgi:hypothetical protein
MKGSQLLNTNSENESLRTFAAIEMRILGSARGKGGGVIKQEKNCVFMHDEEAWPPAAPTPTVWCDILQA